jgi:magnesium-transporting ATPase (P-type)
MEHKTETRKIELEAKTLKHLNTARKWSMFLSITGLIINGLILILSVLAAAFLTIFKTDQTSSRIPEPIYVGVIFTVSFIYFFPLIFLLRFSKHSSRAVHSLNPQDFHKAFKNLKSFFIFIGALVIILLILYVALLIFVGSTMAIPKGMI